MQIPVGLPRGFKMLKKVHKGISLISNSSLTSADGIVEDKLFMPVGSHSLGDNTVVAKQFSVLKKCRSKPGCLIHGVLCIHERKETL